jgi:hypothetical protein
LRNERAKIRRQIRQKACDASDPDEGAGTRVRVEELERRLAELPRRLERLRKSGESKLSRRDGEARFLRERGGFALGYTAEIARSVRILGSWRSGSRCTLVMCRRWCPG